MSKKINFDLIDNSILIMDGTSSYFPIKYSSLGFIIHSVKDLSNYDRTTVHIRNINTTSSRRREKSKPKKKSTQQEVISDLSELKDKHGEIFLICSKEEIPKYEENESLKKTSFINPNVLGGGYEEADINLLSVHLFNTRGKNILNKQTNIYLSSLPIKPPNYYRALVFLLYPNQKLKLRIRVKVSEEQKWFIDKEIQQVYENDLLCELIQIFFRTDLRNLASKKEVNFFIASQAENLIKSMLKESPFEKVTTNFHEPNIKQKNTMKEIAEIIQRFFDNNPDTLETTLGKIVIDGKGKNFLSNYFVGLVKKNQLDYMIELLEKKGLTFFVSESNSYKKVKRI